MPEPVCTRGPETRFTGTPVRAQAAPCVSIETATGYRQERVISPGPCGLRGLSSGLQGRADITLTMRRNTAGRSLAPHPAGPGPPCAWRGGGRAAAKGSWRHGGRGRCRRPVPAAEDRRPAHRGPGLARAPSAAPADRRTADGRMPDSYGGAPSARAPARPRRSPRAQSGSARRPPPSAARGWGAACAPSPGCPCLPAASPAALRDRGSRRPRPSRSGRAPLRPSLRRGVMASAGAGRGRGDAGTRGTGAGGAGGRSTGARAPGTAGTRGRAEEGTGEPGALGLRGPGTRALGAGGAGTPGDREHADGGRFGMAGGRGRGDAWGKDNWECRWKLGLGARGHAGAAGHGDQDAGDPRGQQGLGMRVGSGDGGAGMLGDSERGSGSRLGMAGGRRHVGLGDGVMKAWGAGADRGQGTTEGSEARGPEPGARDGWRGLGRRGGGHWRVDPPGNRGLTSPGQRSLHRGRWRARREGLGCREGFAPRGGCRDVVQTCAPGEVGSGLTDG